jgi:hypothetical protein
MPDHSFWHGSRRSGNVPDRYYLYFFTHKLQAAASKVDKSLSKDEAFENALRAVELYMNVIKLASSDSEKARLTTYIQGYFFKSACVHQGDIKARRNHSIGGL